MKAVLAYIACGLIWGTTWFAIRVCIAPGGYTEFPAAALRFSLAAAILLLPWLLGLARPGPRTRREFLWIAAAGIFNACGYALVYRAERDISGGLAAVMFSTFPLMTAAIAALTRTERFTVGAVVGSAISSAGIALIFWDRLEVSGSQAAAIVMMLVAVLSQSFLNIILKRHASQVNPLASTGVMLTSSALVLWLITACVVWEPLPWPPPLKPTVALVYLAVLGSVVAFASYLYLLQHVKLMTASTLVFVQPIIALGVDGLWEKQVSLGTGAGLGIVVTLLGVVVNLASRAHSSRAAAPKTAT